jgi:hypothetical protein
MMHSCSFLHLNICAARDSLPELVNTAVVVSICKNGQFSAQKSGILIVRLAKFVPSFLIDTHANLKCA